MKPFHIRIMVNKSPRAAMRALPSKLGDAVNLKYIKPTNYTLQKVSSHKIAWTIHFPMKRSCKFPVGNICNSVYE